MIQKNEIIFYLVKYYYNYKYHQRKKTMIINAILILIFNIFIILIFLYFLIYIYKLIYGEQNNIKYDTIFKICQKLTKNRDSSHDVKHMIQVYLNSMKIYKNMCSIRKEPFNSEKYTMIMIVSLMHDIYDHKYDVDGNQKKKLATELIKIGLGKDKIESIFKIIDRISFSYEKRKREEIGIMDQPYIFRELNDFEREIRNIVSDADKLEAMGIIGIHRCLEYTKIHILNNEYVEPSDKELTFELVKHCEEKLFILQDKYYIRTFYGRELAKRKQTLMVDNVISRLKFNNMYKEAERIKLQYKDDI